jgi:hypothetical protein
VLTIDVPRQVGGVTVFRGALASLLSPRLQPDRATGTGLDVPWIGRADGRGFGQWLAEPEGRAFVGAPFTSVHWRSPGRPVLRHAGRVPVERDRSWSPTDADASCDPSSSLFLEVVGTRAAGSGPPHVRAAFLRPGGEGAVETREVTGVWVEGGPAASARAWFDLESDPDWLLCWAGGVEAEAADFASVVAFHVHVAPPALAGVAEPEPDGADWRLDAPTSPPTTADDEGHLVLWLLALDTLERREVRVEVASDGRLVAPDAARLRGRLEADAPGRLAWGLDLRVGQVTVARARGRR